MFSRKNGEEFGKEIPGEWRQSFVATFRETYEKNMVMDKKDFDLFGQIFENELLIITTYYDQKKPELIPITVCISADLEKMDEKKVKAMVSSMVDLTGAIYDDVFAETEFLEYSSQWLETSVDAQEFFYKITRENVILSMQASKLLNSH